MSDILLDPLLVEWYRLRAEILEVGQKMAPKIAREMELRRALMSLLFPTPKEGVNKYSLPNGYTLKGTHKVDRKVDKAALPAILDVIAKRDINTDELIRYTPELELTPYRQLSEEDRKIFDQALIIKPSAPVLELVPPKQQ